MEKTKNLRLEVPEGCTDNCELCPFYTSNTSENREDVCRWLSENSICKKYDFTKLHLWDDLND